MKTNVGRPTGNATIDMCLKGGGTAITVRTIRMRTVASHVDSGPLTLPARWLGSCDLFSHQQQYVNVLSQSGNAMVSMSKRLHVLKGN